MQREELLYVHHSLVTSTSLLYDVQYIVQRSLGLDLPKKMQPAFYRVIQAISEETSKEITPEDIEKAFRSTYFLGEEYSGRFELMDYSFGGEGGKKTFSGVITDGGAERKITGTGNGPVSSLLNALKSAGTNLELDVKELSEHSIGSGADTRAAAYVQLVNQEGKTVWGVGVDEDVTAATLKAVLSAASGI